MDAGQVERASDLELDWIGVQRGIPADSNNEYLRWLKQQDLHQHLPSGKPKAALGDMPSWQYFGSRVARRIPSRAAPNLCAQEFAKVLGGSH